MNFFFRIRMTRLLIFLVNLWTVMSYEVRMFSQVAAANTGNQCQCKSAENHFRNNPETIQTNCNEILRNILKPVSVLHKLSINHLGEEASLTKRIVRALFRLFAPQLLICNDNRGKTGSHRNSVHLPVLPIEWEQFPKQNKEAVARACALDFA